jgi:hypothetical protein
MSTPTAGPVAVMKIGTTTPVTVPGTDWKLDIDAKLKDCSNFLDGRIYVGTLPEGDFSCTIIWDSSAMPTDPAGLNLVPGANVTTKLYTSATKFFSVPLTIAKIEVESKIEDVVMFKVTAKQTGPIVYPVTP